MCTRRCQRWCRRTERAEVPVVPGWSLSSAGEGVAAVGVDHEFESVVVASADEAVVVGNSLRTGALGTFECCAHWLCTGDGWLLGPSSTTSGWLATRCGQSRRNPCPKCPVHGASPVGNDLARRFLNQMWRVEIGDASSFPSAGHLAAYAGHPPLRVHDRRRASRPRRAANGGRTRSSHPRSPRCTTPESRAYYDRT